MLMRVRENLAKCTNCKHPKILNIQATVMNYIPITREICVETDAIIAFVGETTQKSHLVTTGK